MVSKKDYNEIMVQAAKSVLIELSHILGEYHDGIVLIGGWVPPLLLGPGTHVGSIDVDLALDHKTITNKTYAKIGELLRARGYSPSVRSPYVFTRAIIIDGQTVSVEVDFLSGEYGGAAKSRRHQSVQEIKARKARACDLAFSLFTEVKVEGVLPDGGKDSVVVKVASIVPFLVMKGMALHDRLKEKDAWDIYYCLNNYPGSLDALAAEIKKHISNKLVREGFLKISDAFASEKHIGPKMAADFEEFPAGEQRDMLQRDAYEKVAYLLKVAGLRQT
ncbi:MAG: nucleotidyl transferase AbiEii/AbiGii toxin family protein [Elusimicrobia bacterium]|nr:nucleotidyl transferase AbiEii/AbiGii toxin family protein [Elusimicrobiota bacterium]